MSALPSRRPTTSSTNPITSDENLTKLMAEAKDLDTEEAFKGWKDSFLEQYKKYLDPAGVDNAEMSNGRLVRSLEKLASTVVTVNKFVQEGKITADSQSVQGSRHLTNMTEQMAATEKEIARFLPTTGAEEAVIGYDKFELGAVMIEDGFLLYEHLKTTRDIVQKLHDKVFREVMSTNKMSIIQFYLRQIQIFCDVMADLGLFGLMEQMMDIYQIKPRSKSKPEKALPPPLPPKKEKKEKPKRVLDPNKKYNHRAAYTDGYFDPLSGTQPGKEEFESDESDKDDDDDQDGDGDDDDNHFVIYFDMKTGTIGKIPRNVCANSNFIVEKDDGGNEQMQGQIDDDADKEQLIWDMKKALKGAAPSTPKQGPKRTRSSKGVGLKDGKTPLEAKRGLNRSTSSSLHGSSTHSRSDSNRDVGRSMNNSLHGSSSHSKTDPPVRQRRAPPGRAKSLPQDPLRTSSPAALPSAASPVIRTSKDESNPSESKDAEGEDDDDLSEVSVELNDVKECAETKPARRNRPSAADSPAAPVKRNSSARSKSPGRLSKSKSFENSSDATEAGDSATIKPPRRTRPSTPDGAAGPVKRSSTGRSKSPGAMKDVKASGDGWSSATSLGKTRRAPNRSCSTDGGGLGTCNAHETHGRQALSRTKSSPLSSVASSAPAKRASAGRSKSPGPSSPVRNPRPSASGWSSPGALAAKRRSVKQVEN